MKDFQGKVAFITGGASGIGLGMAHCFAQRGMRLALADVEAPALESAAAELEAAGAEVLGLTCDVADRDCFEAAVERAHERFGRIDVACNNAGGSPVGALEETTPEDWRWALGVNLMGVVHGIQLLVPRIRAHGEGGHVVNTASIAGMVALPTLGIYTATKYAVVGISETLRNELAPAGIGVSVLCPSFVRTRLHESGRNRPAELGAAGETPEFVVEAIRTGMDPKQVGESVVRAIEGDALYIFTHADSKLGFQMRADTILQAFPSE